MYTIYVCMQGRRLSATRMSYTPADLKKKIWDLFINKEKIRLLLCIQSFVKYMYISIKTLVLDNVALYACDGMEVRRIVVINKID